MVMKKIWMTTNFLLIALDLSTCNHDNDWFVRFIRNQVQWEEEEEKKN